MARYPSIVAGQRITADLLNAMIPQTVYKTAHTDRASTITVSDDPDLQVQLPVGVHFVEMYLMAGGTLAGDIKTVWRTSGSMSGLKTVLGPSSTASNANADQITMRDGTHGFGTEILYSGVRDGTGLLFGVVEWAVVTVTTAGTLALQWAQGTSSTAASRIAAGSLMRVTQLG